MKIQGKNAISEALKGDVNIEKILVEKGTSHEIISLARAKGVKIQFVDKYLLDKLCPDKKHQGFVAEISEFNYCELEDILAAKGENHFILLLDGVEDPHNLGSIMRVCECAGVDGIVIPKNRSCGVNDTVIRVSSGASAYVKVAKVTNINTTIEQLKKQNIWVYCADMEGQEIYKTDLTGNIAIVIGGEGKGVSTLCRSLCDGVVSLPLLGQVNSLNASVACGIVLYEALRQRQGK